jgi:Uma2 family endonuclease
MQAVITMPDVLDAEPTWEIAQLFPDQGQWGEEEYLGLETNHLVEFSHGKLDFLTMPSVIHQEIVVYLFHLLSLFVATRKLGKVLVAPLRVQLWRGKFREPDVVLLLKTHLNRQTAQYWIGADLVMEVVSPDDRHRDTVTKRREYAQAGIPEYWIVDPELHRITVLRLQDQTYVEHGDWGEGEQATSVLLPGFVVSVDDVFATED